MELDLKTIGDFDVGPDAVLFPFTGVVLHLLRICSISTFLFILVSDFPHSVILFDSTFCLTL
jgi:hypothetical protein